MKSEIESKLLTRWRVTKRCMSRSRHEPRSFWRDEDERIPERFAQEGICPWKKIICKFEKNDTCGVRTHAELPPADLKSAPLDLSGKVAYTFMPISTYKRQLSAKSP